MSLELDSRKAYDQIEWSYLCGVLTKMGFSMKWIELIMVCVSSVSYFYIINGCPHGYIFTPFSWPPLGRTHFPYCFSFVPRASRPWSLRRNTTGFSEVSLSVRVLRRSTILFQPEYQTASPLQIGFIVRGAVRGVPWEISWHATRAATGAGDLPILRIILGKGCNLRKENYWGLPKRIYS